MKYLNFNYFLFSILFLIKCSLDTIPDEPNPGGPLDPRNILKYGTYIIADSLGLKRMGGFHFVEMNDSTVIGIGWANKTEIDLMEQRVLFKINKNNTCEVMDISQVRNNPTQGRRVLKINDSIICTVGHYGIVGSRDVYVQSFNIKKRSYENIPFPIEELKDQFVEWIEPINTNSFYILNNIINSSNSDRKRTVHLVKITYQPGSHEYQFNITIPIEFNGLGEEIKKIGSKYYIVGREFPTSSSLPSAKGKVLEFNESSSSVTATHLTETGYNFYTVSNIGGSIYIGGGKFSQPTKAILATTLEGLKLADYKLQPTKDDQGSHISIMTKSLHSNHCFAAGDKVILKVSDTRAITYCDICKYSEIGETSLYFIDQLKDKSILALGAIESKMLIIRTDENFTK